MMMMMTTTTTTTTRITKCFHSLCTVPLNLLSLRINCIVQYRLYCLISTILPYILSVYFPVITVLTPTHCVCEGESTLLKLVSPPEEKKYHLITSWNVRTGNSLLKTFYIKNRSSACKRLCLPWLLVNLRFVCIKRLRGLPTSYGSQRVSQSKDAVVDEYCVGL